MVSRLNSKKRLLQKEHLEQMKLDMLKKLAIEKRLEEIDKKYAENQTIDDFDRKNFTIDSYGQKGKICNNCRNFDW